MSSTDSDALVASVAAGLEALQVEYQKLNGQHQALERRLATTREQYNELAKLCKTSGALSSPPLSLSPSENEQRRVATATQTAADILDERRDKDSQDAADKIREARRALDALKQNMGTHPQSTVKIWSGRSADEPRPNHRAMPAVQESPLERDFTIEGVPSKLGCPFASMANKKLSSHAASVLSRYGHGSQGGGAGTSVSAASRINGRESFARRNSQRASFADPVDAAIPPIADEDHESPHSERKAAPDGISEAKLPEAEVGVCPIRFLDQQSPEEVATYFEKHKHELPRSHEVCVKRYQSNEHQIRQLDAKYGNLVNMIQGLGAKHQNLLPKDPDEEPVDPAETAASAEKVRKWASSVSLRADDGNGAELKAGGEERLPHFERPLRDIRVGESPSRPWGISIPPRYLERKNTGASSEPARPREATLGMEPVSPADEPIGLRPSYTPMPKKAPAGKCPFNHAAKAAESRPACVEQPPAHQPAPLAEPSAKAIPAVNSPNRLPDGVEKSERIVFTGPVFFGYSAEEAAKMLQLMK